MIRLRKNGVNSEWRQRFDNLMTVFIPHLKQEEDHLFAVGRKMLTPAEISPGIRIGFVIAEPDAIRALVLAKQAADLQTNSLLQRAVYYYGTSGYLDRHIPTITESYRLRAGTMLEAMGRYFPSTIRWVPPEGGMFVWCMLTKGLSSTKLFPKAVQAKVAYVTGQAFHANGGGEQTLRLNFTNSTAEQIEEGIKPLGRVFSKEI